ncbi:MAG: hypothetical protein QXK31_01195 [Fervidicoccaceae archaeon]
MGLSSSLLVSTEDFLKMLEGSYGYSRAMLWVRTLQWMGLIEPVEVHSPFLRGIRAIEVKLLPILEIIQKQKCPSETKVCILPFLSLLLPTPFRRVMLFSLTSRSIEEIAEKMLKNGSAAERIIAVQHFISEKNKMSDLVFLLIFLFSTGILRRGKKSDRGGNVAYLREQLRGLWREHPCFKKSPLLGKDLVEAESFLFGRLNWEAGGGGDPNISFMSFLDNDSRNCLFECLYEVKSALPKILLEYEDLWDIRKVGQRGRTVNS